MEAGELKDLPKDGNSLTARIKEMFKTSTGIKMRHELVGKRILCIPKTFELQTPSPTKLSSSLWSQKAVQVLKESGKVSQLNWCSKHHHHQDDQEELVGLVDRHKLMIGEDRSQFGPNKRSKVNRQSTTKTSYQVMKRTKHQQEQQLLLLQSNFFQQTNLPANEQIQESERDPKLPLYSTCKSCDANDSKVSMDCHLGSLPWASGIIRAVSHKNLEDANLKLMIEFDLHDWNTRDWYYVHSRTALSESVHSPEMSLMSEVESSTAETILLPSDFRVLLIESSICATRREKAPTGNERLWAALLFEPFVDEIGLFVGKNKEFQAIEYFDPAMDALKPICDIDSIVNDLESELSTFCVQTNYQKLCSNASTDEKESSTSESNILNIENENYLQTSCDCWSPRVDFRHRQFIYNFNQNLMSKPGLTTTDETDTRAFKVIDSTVSESSQSSAQDTDSSKIIPTVAQSLFQNRTGSFKSYLRFFHLLNATIKKPLEFKSESVLTNDKNLEDRNDLLNAMLEYPQLYQDLKSWHHFQDSQRLITSAYTASLLVSNRVRVYRVSGTTQYYTAIIIQAGADSDSRVTLIDDTVLEEHHEDPCLLEIHLIDDGIVQTLIEGNVPTRNVPLRPRRTRAINQPRTTPKSTVNSLAGSGHNGTVISKQQIRATHSHLSSPSPSASSSSSALSLAQQPLDSSQTSKTTNFNLVSEGASSLTKGGSFKQASLTGGKDESAKSRGRRAPNELADLSFIGHQDPWINKSAYQDGGESVGTDTSEIELISELESVTQEEDRFVAPLEVSAASEHAPRLGRHRLDGRNFISHRLRLEALGSMKHVDEAGAISQKRLKANSHQDDENSSCLKSEQKDCTNSSWSESTNHLILRQKRPLASSDPLSPSSLGECAASSVDE